jgi:acyl-[acyl-carrier-protein]-phospholipid O-acyltransferase/long-chain-fatty-acid--[acyl-carrier-protein] ligase
VSATGIPNEPARTDRLGGFWSLWVTQFQGAFNDNAFRNLVIFIVLGLTLTAQQRDWLVLQAGTLFSLPFLLFSMAGGYLADRFSKRTVTIATKMMEVAVMAVGLLALATLNLGLLMVTVFLMGMQSAFFGPSKYGLLPELLSPGRLSWGNGLLQLGTYVAVIAGTLAAGLMSDAFRHREHWSGVILIGLACVGLVCSLGISRVPVADPSKKFRPNFLADLWAQIQRVRADRVLTLAVIGNVYFSFLGMLLLLNVMIYGKDVLAITDTQISVLQGAVGIGIGLGAFAAGVLSGRKIEYGLVPLGSAGLTVFSALMVLPDLSLTTVGIYLGLAGFFSGFFIVPIAALLQHRPAPQHRGAVLGAANLLSFVGIFLAFVAHFVFTRAGLSPGQIFLAGAVMTLAGTAYALYLLPAAMLRFVVWVLVHTFYRLRVEGRENIPEKGGALFVCNHVSFVDALLIIGSTDRMIRAVMFKDIYEHPIVKPFAMAMNAIPISSQQRPREMIRSLRAASEAIRQGHVVCIFAEGQITRIGQMLPFRRGMQLVLKDLDAPIIPVCLDNVWGSIFSYQRGRFFGKLPRYIPYPVTVSYGKPMPPTSTPVEVRQAVQQLNTEAWHHRKRLMLPLPQSFIRNAHRHPLLFFMADMRVPRLNLGSALLKTLFLARRLKPVWKEQQMVGILLPPSVPGALVNYAALLLGKVPVNLNYTVSDEVLAACAQQCGLKTVITSRAFLDKVKLKVPGQAVLLEDCAANPRLAEKVRAALLWPIPAPWLARLLRQPLPQPSANAEHPLDQLATVIFSSGSTGQPKGVMLTQYNIISNIEQLGQTFAFRHHDKLLGILPFFHSFGFTAALMLPATLAMGVVYHPNPLDAKAVGDLVEKYAVTFLLATPTFLQMYIRGCEPEQFGSLQYVVTGAEKLPARLAQAFEDRFGIRPLEGYGCTECGPAVAVNTRDFRAPGFRQVGAKRGTIGHPLPGVSVKIVDPDVFEPLPIGQPGLLLARGPNVMKGYLGQPEKTAEVLRDGWYVTGDIAAMDEDGFLTITDRLSRFSKIGGEMVPHIRVEEKLHELAGATQQCFAVTGLPDEKKGERLAVLHTLSAEELKPVLDALAACDLPNLWKPRPDQFLRVDALPYLGTGKLDLRKLRELAGAQG